MRMVIFQVWSSTFSWTGDGTLSSSSTTSRSSLADTDPCKLRGVRTKLEEVHLVGLCRHDARSLIASGFACHEVVRRNAAELRLGAGPRAAVACSEVGVPQTGCCRVEQVAAGRVKCRVGGDLNLLTTEEPLL